MADYNYKAGKKRIKDILNNKLQVIENNKIPNNENFTFSNAYYGWVTAIFVDIRNSTDLFSKGNKEIVSKMIRSFTSEIIEILRNDDNLREIGIRGDCIYAIYATPNKQDDLEIINKSFYINTFMKMLNKLLVEKGFSTMSVGIGVSTAQELVVKAGRKDVNINNSVWIGDAVTKASNLSSLGNKENYKSILISESVYKNINDSYKENWFTVRNSKEIGKFYDCDIIKTAFNNWIDSGMRE
ncbi:adenylate/guanylate cyclase domain-containing protein [Aliarcobacter butzleri]|uniref:adenylate/guanylate cyclase domain-containing protein n=1 Tax=Aliarcobacter butzleri TaxID=28197 RepID=UPI003AED4CEB